MQRPKIKIELNKIDLTIETIGVIGLILTFMLLILNYNDLPEIIPRHFSGRGEPDGFGKKVIIWILPTTALTIYILMTIVLRYPHTFNYLIEITVENAERQYRNAMMMMRVLKTVIVAIFSYLTYATIQNGLGEMNGLGILFLPIFIALISGTIGIFIYRGNKLR